MQKLPNIYKAQDIEIGIIFIGTNAQISINGVSESDFSEEFYQDFEIDNIEEIKANILVNNIRQDYEPTVEIENENLTIQIPLDENKDFEKGLLEIELVTTYTMDDTNKTSINRIPIAWLLNSAESAT